MAAYYKVGGIPWNEGVNKLFAKISESRLSPA